MQIIHSNLLNSDLQWTDSEVESGKKYLKWEELTLKWHDVDLTWDEVFVVIEFIRHRGSGGYSGDYERGNPWRQVAQNMGEEKTKKIIKLYCRVQGVDYDYIREPIEDVRITINELNRFTNQVKVKVGL